MRKGITYWRVADTYAPICASMAVKDILIRYFHDVPSYHLNKLDSLELISENGRCLFPIIVVGLVDEIHVLLRDLPCLFVWTEFENLKISFARDNVTVTSLTDVAS